MPYKKTLLLFFCAFMIAAAGCKKKKKDVPDPVTPPAQEADLAVAIPNIFLNEARNAAQGSTLGIKVNITSTPVPPSGVTITVTALDPAGVPIPQNPAFDSTTPSTDVTLINLPSLKVADILLTVTSKTKPSNTKQFRFGVMNKTP